jgi:putative integral membrane protein (TIGR02587 family)
METSSWAEDALDGLIAFGVGVVAATVILLALALLGPGLSLRELAGRVALQAVPGSFGAVLANSQFSADRQELDEEAAVRRGGYPVQLLFMLTGAVFLAFNIAPTEEIVLLAVAANPPHLVALVVLTLGMMHGFVYASGFRGTPRTPAAGAAGLFLRFTLVGYAVALGVSLYILWTFGRLGGGTAGFALAQALVLALPAGLGAAAARLVL